MDTFARIENDLRAIDDPVAQLMSCDEVYHLAMDLIMATGANGLRREAANRAIKKHGAAEAARLAEYTMSTLRRVAGR
jgi:hypothetical protein